MMPNDQNRSARNKEKTDIGTFYIEILRGIVPLLWFALAAVAFIFFYPLAEAAIKNETLNKVKVGVVEFELSHVTLQPHVDAVEVAKEAMLIDPMERKRITNRFASMAAKTTGATLLWVDDEHPYQNVAERRVLVAAGIAVDQARSTDEALQWLYRANYDALITDLNRASPDPRATCFQGQEISNAGCALLKRIGDCFQSPAESEQLAERRRSASDPESRLSEATCTALTARPNAKMPTMIVYSAAIRPDWPTPPYAQAMTNRATKLFDYVLDALERRREPLPTN
jgi:hypothetical protein